MSEKTLKDIPSPDATATLSAVWRGAAVSCVVLYERHPAAGSLAYPGPAVSAKGRIGRVKVTHCVSEKGEEFYVWLDGPDELDPMDGCAFGMGAGGDSLQDALDELAKKLDEVQKWCVAQ
jgi:hypothetical protein